MMNQKLFWILVAVIGVLLVMLVIPKNDEKIEREEIAQNVSGEQTKILLYFWNTQTQDYEQEYHEVSLEKIKNNMYQTILEELINGPISSDLTSFIPKETTVIGVEQSGNRLVVNLSKEYELGSGDKEIRGNLIVNSLTEIKEIDEVEIQVEGSRVFYQKRSPVN